MKYVEYVRKRFANAPALKITDLKVALGTRGISKNYLHLLVHNLLASGELKKITRGTYTFRDDAETVGFAFTPFYYGLEEALSLRNLWEQETNPVVITPRRVRSGVRTFEGRNYAVRHIAREMFFGFELVKYGDFWIPVSDAEKTLIDFVYFKQPLPQSALKELVSATDAAKLNKYLKRCPRWLEKRARQALEGKKLPKSRKPG